MVGPLNREVLAVYAVLMSVALAAEVSGWDKTAAIAAVIAAAVVVLSALGWLCVRARVILRNLKNRLAVSVSVDGCAFVGIDHASQVVLRLKRDVYFSEPRIHLQDAGLRQLDKVEIPGVTNWADTWVDATGEKVAFPRNFKRGEELMITFHVKAERTWEGVLVIETYHYDPIFRIEKPFEVLQRRES